MIFTDDREKRKKKMKRRDAKIQIFFNEFRIRIFRIRVQPGCELTVSRFCTYMVQYLQVGIVRQSFVPEIWAEEGGLRFHVAP